MQPLQSSCLMRKRINRLLFFHLIGDTRSAILVARVADRLPLFLEGLRLDPAPSNHVLGRMPSPFFLLVRR